MPHCRARALPLLATGLVLAVAGALGAHAPQVSVEAIGLRSSQSATTPAAASAAVTAQAMAVSPAKRAGVTVTPGRFTGHGFDQCLAPDQTAMDRWLESSPYLAAGIYIAGDSRGCRSQPNLTPTWIATQLARGWRLLPITLGPQASCQPSFPRYGTDATIDPSATGDYAAARNQGIAEAGKSVSAAQALGLSAGSTLWYDLEGFDATDTACRESALSFLSGWTEQLHALGWVSGVYSSAGSGIQELDRARVTRPTRFALPDQIWIARWDGVANTSTTYIAEDGWRPGGRMKQYRGGHVETYGGTSINIDSNWLELGAAPVAKAMTQCGPTQVEFATYTPVHAPRNGKTSGKGQVKALQCLLSKKKAYGGRLTGRWDPRTDTAVRAWQAKAGLGAKGTWTRKAWQVLLSSGATPTLKIGSTGMSVRRVQRALNTKAGVKGPVDGVYSPTTQAVVVAWQARVGLEQSGVVGVDDWAALQSGRR